MQPLLAKLRDSAQFPGWLSRHIYTRALVALSQIYCSPLFCGRGVTLLHKSLAGFSAVGMVCPSVCLSAVWMLVGQVDYFTTANTGLFIRLTHVYLLEVVFVSSLDSTYYFVSVVIC